MHPIAIVVNKLAHLKVLQAVIFEFACRKIPLIIYHKIGPMMPGLEYDRPTEDRIIRSLGGNLCLRFVPFTDNRSLLPLLKKNKTKNLVGAELTFWDVRLLKWVFEEKINTYSIQYLIDSLWNTKDQLNYLNRVYYAAPFIMNLHHKFNSIVTNPKRDLCLGNPMFDCFRDCAVEQPSGPTLVFLPHLPYRQAFGSEQNCLRILNNLNDDLWFKLRKKQHVPDQIMRAAQRVEYDSDSMWPPITKELFKQTKRTVIFNSTGIFEAVMAGHYVVNIKIPFDVWPWNKKHMSEFFDGELYNYKGVAQSINQTHILHEAYSLYSPSLINRQAWIKKFIGTYPDKSYRLITNNILDGLIS